MTAQAAPAPAPAGAPLTPWQLSLHGTDPATGRRATWHITAPDAGDVDPGWCRVDRVDGEITDAAVWMQATKSSTTMRESEVFALVSAVAGD